MSKDSKMTAAEIAKQTGIRGKVDIVMADGKFRSLDDLVQRCGGTTASVSARLRDLRKPKFGGRRVECKRMGVGYYLYRLAPAESGEEGKTNG